MSEIWKPRNPVLYALAAFVVSASMLPTARAQFVQQGNKLVGSGAAGSSSQGASAALSADGNTAIIGGVGDNNNLGAAWVYTRAGETWSQQGSKLVFGTSTGTSSDPPALQQGVSVALSADGNTAIIGAAGDAAVGVFGQAALVYTRSGGTWSQRGKLVHSGAATVDYTEFGYSVAISADGNTVIVGGPIDGVPQIGAAWVFTGSGATWSQQGNKLVGTGAAGNPFQGISVAISADGNTVIVGGFGDNNNVGAAWVYTRSGGTWSQQGAKLVGTGAVGHANQGNSVALSADGNTAIVGGPGDNNNAGAAWVYTRAGGTWSQQGAKLVCSDGVGSSGLAAKVALSADGNTAIIGGGADNGGVGAAWLYARAGGTWSQQGAKLVGNGSAGNANQGRSVAIFADGNTAIVGGAGDNSHVGAAWVFANGPAKPTIAGIVNDASFTAGGAISSGSWVAIFGTGLAPTGDSRKWNEATEIVNGKLPVSLDGTSVMVNGKQATVEFIQPSQVNIQAPDDSAVGPVQVVVTTANGTSNSFTTNYATFAPGLFPATSPYIVAQHADNSYVTSAAPAKPGEVIILWSTGFGPANPAVPAGQVFSGANRLANTVTVTIGGQPAAVDFAGVVGAGLVQVNVHVPSSIGNGDAGVVASVGGVSTQTTANMIPIHN